MSIRKSVESDLEVFFQNQADEEANYMAAYTSEDPNDRDAYITKWTRLMKVYSVHMQSILLDDKVIGCVVKFVMGGDADITYAISKEYWGKGITTKAVNLFLELEHARPLFGRVANDNYGSQKVLENSGFNRIGKNTDFANARSKEIEEYIYSIES
jgi:ribosomal-protein-alanine N-acetyltransferase